MENYNDMMQLLRDFFNPKFEDLVKSIDDYNVQNEHQHTELYKQANRVPVLEEQNRNQQQQIDLLFKWVVAAFGIAFISLLGVTTSLIIFLATKG